MLTSLGLITLLACSTPPDQRILQADQWEKITLSFEGPAVSEQAVENPFLNYRMQVTFRSEALEYRIPGFYAADGNAGETSADSGSIWQVRFRPPTAGTWSYEAHLRKGSEIAVSDDPDAGELVPIDHNEGVIEVASTTHPGRLITTDSRYLKYANADSFFLKGGADSPENFLAFHEFDGTYRSTPPEERSGEATAMESLHKYEAHIRDWRQGDPTWQNGKGKGIIGALNYLAGKGMNSVYFLTMNIEGDGKDVWPYTSYEERLRFDCSKLDQWEIVFDHMDRLGLMLHIVTQETENERLLDDGDTGLTRKLYYRELIARFAHHLAITWNLGEENGPMDFSPNGQTTEQQKAMAEYIKTHDPYNNFLVIHSHHNNTSKEELFTPLLGFPYLDGMSIQNGNPHQTHVVTKEWIAKSAAAGKPWVMCLDELGPHYRGIDPDDRPDNNQDTMRAVVLWANLMAGGGGVEWYFGYRNHNNDLGCEDWRSRDRLWDYTRIALEFFQSHLPFTTMTPHDELLQYPDKGYCFANPGEIYAVYLPLYSNCQLDLQHQDGLYLVRWYNPREGGELVTGSVSTIQGNGIRDLGSPVEKPGEDWVGLIRKE